MIDNWFPSRRTPSIAGLSFLGVPRKKRPQMRGVGGVLLVLAVCAVPACTTYHALPRDGGTGGGIGGPAGSSGDGAGAGGALIDAGALEVHSDANSDATIVDSGADRGDTPAVIDARTIDTGFDGPRDTLPPLLANGATCRNGAECQFGNCVDDVCCESACVGQCQACAEPNQLGQCVTISGVPRGTVRVRCGGIGTCAAVCNGSDPLACQYPRSEKQCTPANCTAGVAKVASTCDGVGACSTVTGMACVSNLCADATQCAGGCSTAQPCGTGQYCEPTTKACLPLKANGDACTQGQDFACASGQCVDGVCCDSACGGQCESCAEGTSKGRCVAVTGAPRGSRRPACSGTRDACRGVCEGTSRTQCAYPGGNVTCVPASCTSGSLTGASVCNTLGDYTFQPAPMACHSGQCSATPGQCLICAAGLACDGGLVCDAANGVCVAPAALNIAPASPPAFASTQIGLVSASQTLVVTNTGAVTAGATTGLVSALGGTSPGEFRIVTASTTCSGAMAGGGHCNVVVTFNPSTAGAKSATLTVTATPGGSTSVTISGTGLRRLGDPCGASGDCANGVCTDGHCCTVASCGTCMVCTGAAGTCAAAPVNSTACALGTTRCLSETTLQTCSMVNACTTGYVSSTCTAGLQVCSGNKCGFKDGSGCASGDQCASGVCNFFLVDADHDGYGPSFVEAGLCTVTVPPVGYATLAGDCCDSNPLINPGADFQPMIGDCNGTPTWDYNCSGSIEKARQSCNVTSCSASACVIGCADFPDSQCGLTGVTITACSPSGPGACDTSGNGGFVNCR